jgi:PAS domain S-box-containing protein
MTDRPENGLRPDTSGLSEARLKHIFNAVLEGIVVIDPHGIITEINDSALQMFGYSRTELTGHDCSLLMPRQIAAEHDGYLSKYMRTGEKHILREPRRVFGRRKNGEEFPIRIAVNETLVNDSCSFIAVIEDVSLSVQTEKALREAKEAAEAASQLKSDFLARMSHELRTPLNAILGHAQLLGAGLNMHGEATLDKATINEHTNRIMQSGWHLLSLIEEVLDLAKVEAGREQVALEPVSLEPVLRSCQEQLQYQADKHGISLQPKLMPDRDVRVMAEPRRLRQVLLNLLSNGINYNRAKGEVQIRVRPTTPGRVVIEVHDTGRGMSPEQLQQLFQPFVRFIRPGDTIAGAGVGLALCRRLVENMNGRIEVSSEPNKGSIVSVELDEAPQDIVSARPSIGSQNLGLLVTKAVDRDPSAPVTAAPQRRPADGKPVHPVELDSTQRKPAPARILYIEDTPANFEIVHMYLELQGGYLVECAEDGETGLQMAISAPPDLILLDMSLPGMQGMDVKRHLAKDPATMSIPVVALTAAAMNREVDAAMVAGFSDYLTKPVRLARLKGVIDKLLARA